MGVHDPRSLQTIENVFDLFCSANTMHGILSSFSSLCSLLGIHGNNRRHLFQVMQSKLSHYWKAKALFTKLSKRAEHKDYGRGLPCNKINALIIGAGPCGLRTSIELALLGANVIVLEKRDKFSRNNVLHLWPYLIDDLRSLGAKKFFGKFCFGSIDHISIRTLQCILLKVALIFGVRVVPEVEFECMLEPSSPDGAWRLQYKGRDLPFLRDYTVNVLIGADGKRNTLPGFRHKQFRAKLAIAITVNFLNKHTQEEALVKEISGLSFIFNQKFFLDLKERAGIDLENIVYYKDETHYFVMTAKKSCLMSKGVLRDDFDDPAKLLDRDNINKDNLLRFAREAAVESTNPQLPHVDFALNQYGQPDVAVFDFTSLFAAENASRIVSRHGKELLMSLVGDSLLEPFWPTGSGCARGFLGAFDAAWMVRRFGIGKMNLLELLAERESIYQRLSQTESDKMNKNYGEYSIDPRTRYPGLDAFCVRPRQVTHMLDTDRPEQIEAMLQDIAARTPTRLAHLTSAPRSQEVSDSSGAREPEVNWDRCLRWFQVKLCPYENIVEVRDLTHSWFNGVGLLCLIHLYRPDLVDLMSISADDPLANATRAFNLFDSEFGVSPLLSPEELLKAQDQLTMCSYLEQVYEALRQLRPAKENRQTAAPRRWTGSLSLASRLTARQKQQLLRRDQADVEEENMKRHRTRDHRQIESGLFEKRAAQLQEALNQDMAGAPYAKDPANRRSINVLKATNRGKVTDLATKLFKEQPELPTPLPGGGLPKRSKVVIPEALRSIDHPGQGRPRGSSAPQPMQAGGSRVAALAAKVSALSSATQASSDRCYFCGTQVYLVERMTAEGYFFHRGCLKCAQCGTRLRLSTYVFHRMPDGRGLFYCFAHYAVRHAAEVPRDLYDYYDEQTLFYAGGSEAGAGPSEEEVGVSSRNNNFRTPERAEFQYYAEELREVDEESICDYNRLSMDYLEGEEEEEEEEDEEQEVFARQRKFSWENAVEVARRLADKRNSAGTLDGSSTDFDSTSLGLDLGSESEAEEGSGPATSAAQAAAVPVIQRDTAAKQKFYMEAPKPVQINALSFFAKCNLQKLRFTELRDLTEKIEELSEPEQVTVQPYAAPRPSEGRLRSYCDVTTPIGDQASKVTCTDYFAERWEACCEDAQETPPQQIPLLVEPGEGLSQAVVHQEDAAQSHLMAEPAGPRSPGPTANGLPNGLTSLELPMAPLTFEDLSDIHDIDSSSVPTENSCASETEFSMPVIEVAEESTTTNGHDVKTPAFRREEELLTSTPDTAIPAEPQSPWAQLRLDDEDPEPMPRPASPTPCFTPDVAGLAEHHRCLLHAQASFEDRHSSRDVSTHSLHTSRTSSSCSLPEATRSCPDTPEVAPGRSEFAAMKTPADSPDKAPGRSKEVTPVEGATEEISMKAPRESATEEAPKESAKEEAPQQALSMKAPGESNTEEKADDSAKEEAPPQALSMEALGESTTEEAPQQEISMKAEESAKVEAPVESAKAEEKVAEESAEAEEKVAVLAEESAKVEEKVAVLAEEKASEESAKAEEKVAVLADPEPELHLPTDEEEHVYENLIGATSLSSTRNSAAGSSLYQASSPNEEASKSSLPPTDSATPSSQLSGGARVVRRRKRRVRKVKGGAGLRGSVDTSQADSSTTGDEEGLMQQRRQNRMSVPLFSRWKDWFSSSSDQPRSKPLKGRHSSLGDLVEAGSVAKGEAGCRRSAEFEMSAAELEELHRQEKRRRQLARERELFEIQCQLEEVDARLRQLEDRGVLAEQSLRRSDSHDVDQGAMTDWLALIHEKNELLRLESELTVSSKELELTYRQECLEEQYRQRMQVPEPDKTSADREEEEQLLHALVKVVEERDALVSYLEELRQREKKKDTDMSAYMALRGTDEAELSVDEKLMLGATQESKLI